MRTSHFIRPVVLAMVVLLTAACSDDDTSSQPDAPPASGDASPTDAAAPATTWRQVEHLARPGIAEALLLSDGFLAGYNGTAPTFTGVPAETLDQVVGEAKTVLKAIYLGVCLVNGAAGLTASTGLKPAGMQCSEVGTGLFSDGAGTVLEPAVATAAQAYADAVFDQFEPDVMRIDTAVASGYLTLCGSPTSKPLLCGGRTLTDDSIDITYDYLLAGAAIHLDPSSPAQFRALVSDGVQYDRGGSGSQNAGNVTTPDPTNANQFHPAVSATFPYSAPPF
jgi:hypothetical protein